MSRSRSTDRDSPRRRPNLSGRGTAIDEDWQRIHTGVALLPRWLPPDVSRAASASGAGVGVVVDAAEALGVDVAVHLRRREGAMAEQLLDRAQVGPALQEM